MGTAMESVTDMKGNELLWRWRHGLGFISLASGVVRRL
jgi:hypothetical protein